MTLLVNYPSKKAVKASIGQPLDYTETGLFGPEYRPDGWLTVAHRPGLHRPALQRGTAYYARILMSNGLITKVT